MYKPPNPMDPFDTFKRWYRELWPADRFMVWVCAAAVITAAGFWVTM